MNRFDLVVINRVFQFSADSLEESQVWISVLHAAISRFKPQEVKEGGNMSDPDRQGFILKQGHGPFAKFKERQVPVLFDQEGLIGSLLVSRIELFFYFYVCVCAVSSCADMWL